MTTFGEDSREELQTGEKESKLFSGDLQNSDLKKEKNGEVSLV